MRILGELSSNTPVGSIFRAPEVQNRMKSDVKIARETAAGSTLSPSKWRIFELTLLRQRTKELVDAGFDEYIPALKLAQNESAFESLDRQTLISKNAAVANLVRRAKCAPRSLPSREGSSGRLKKNRAGTDGQHFANSDSERQV